MAIGKTKRDSARDLGILEAIRLVGIKEPVDGRITRPLQAPKPTARRRHFAPGPEVELAAVQHDVREDSANDEAQWHCIVGRHITTKVEYV